MYDIALVIWTVTVFLTAVDAQSSSSLGACCAVDPNTLSSTTRSSTCQANMATCTTLCGGSPQNTCDQNTLEYTCICPNGIEPDMSAYASTVPSIMCSEWISQCVSDAVGNAQAQQNCKAQICGNKKAALLPETSSSQVSSTSSASRRPPASSTFSRTATASTQSPATSSSDALSTSSTSPPASTTPPSNNSGSKQDSFPQPKGPGLSTGAIVGLVVGIIFLLMLITTIQLLCKRKRKLRRQNALWNEKDMIPSTSAIPIKAELGSDHIVEMPAQPGRGAELPSGTVAAELASPTWPMTAELFASEKNQRRQFAELQASNDYAAVANSSLAWHGTTRSSSVAQTPIAAYGDFPPPRTWPAAREQYTSAVLTERSVQGLSGEEVERLREEEKRIDAEMEAVRRMKELRERKVAVKEKLLGARGG